MCIHRIERFVCHHFHKTKVSDSISPQARRINGRPNKNTEEEKTNREVGFQSFKFARVQRQEIVGCQK